jgi:tetratricopeptide (TPR) repeat protein
MRNVAKFGAILVLACLMLLVVGWWALPRVVEALPGSLRGRLPEEMLAYVTTPLPTALPVPAGVSNSDSPEIVVPTFTTGDFEATTTVPTTRIRATSETIIDGLSLGTVEPRESATNTPTPKPTPTATIIPAPRRAQVDGLKVIPQKFNNCGPANLTMVVNYYGQVLDQLEVGGVVKPNYDDRNVSPGELVDYVNSETPLRASWYSGGDLVLLKRLLAAGYPIIVEKGLHPSEQSGWMGHYLTIYGYDDFKEEFLSLDSFLGPWDSSGRLVDYETMNGQWEQFNNTFLLVYSADDENEVYSLLGPQMLEPTLMWQNAALTAEKDVGQEPENAYAWFNLGSSLTELAALTGDETLYKSAAVAFDRALKIGLPWRMLWYQFMPYAAYLAAGRYEDVLGLTRALLSNGGGQHVEETYLYHGHALLASGDVNGARKAYQRALRLKPSYVQAQEALDTLVVTD